jgi:OFA family oxalate/formate antiporter-like MFS transporter
MGYYSDRAGRAITMSTVFLAAGCAYFLLPHTNELILASLSVAVIGFGFGTLFAVSGPLAADCFGLEHFGAIFGLILTGYGFVAGLLGPALSGYIIDVTHGNFVIVFSYFGVFSVISGTIIRFVTPPAPDAAKGA